MREIKHQAWDARNRKMYQPNDIVVGEYGVLLIDPDVDGIQVELTDFISRQYTGLKDKNGKEIYEGDIVKWFEEKSAVIWREIDACFTAKVIKKYPEYYAASFLKNFEIIGNIYESPELLEGL